MTTLHKTFSARLVHASAIGARFLTKFEDQIGTRRKMEKSMNPVNRTVGAVLATFAVTCMLGQSVQAQTSPLIPNEITASTVPLSGDVNPYGAAFVPSTFATKGILNPGDLLVTNFNNQQNLQGTGKSVMRITPQGVPSVFCTAQSGVSTALGFLSAGFVLVGSVPTKDGTSATVQNGGITVWSKNGQHVGNYDNSHFSTNYLNGPWGIAVYEDPKAKGTSAAIFVSNVLSGTVVRFNTTVQPSGHLNFTSITVIGTGYIHRTDPAALVVGPCGLAYDPISTNLYVASTGDNAIYAIPNALKRTDATTQLGTLVYQDNVHLHGPLGLALAPNGHLLTSNGDAVNADPAHPNEITEFSVDGKFVAAFPINPGNAGAAFGLALSVQGNLVVVAAVDDDSNSVHLFQLGGK